MLLVYALLPLLLAPHSHAHLVYLKNLWQSIPNPAAAFDKLLMQSGLRGQQQHHPQMHADHQPLQPWLYPPYTSGMSPASLLPAKFSLSSHHHHQPYSTILTTHEQLYSKPPLVHPATYYTYNAPQPFSPSVPVFSSDGGSGASDDSYTLLPASSPLVHTSYASLPVTAAAAAEQLASTVVVQPPTPLMLAPRREPDNRGSVGGGGYQTSAAATTQRWPPQQQPRPVPFERTAGTQRYIDICMITTTGAYAIPTDPAGVQPFCPY